MVALSQESEIIAGADLARKGSFICCMIKRFKINTKTAVLQDNFLFALNPESICLQLMREFAVSVVVHITVTNKWIFLFIGVFDLIRQSEIVPFFEKLIQFSLANLRL